MSLALLGDTLILVGLACAAAGVIVGFTAGRSGSAEGLAWSRRLAYAFSASMILAVLVMEYALVTHDFSVKYVAKVGSLQTPLYITIVSLWSSLEGSILFWGGILGIYTAAFTFATRKTEVESVPYALGTTLLVGAFFCFLMAGPATPFSPGPAVIPTDGPGPNPLLQNHILMIIHPPMLYLGYVGMTMPFGVAVAALVRGQLGPEWQRMLRITLLVPWAFLTAGIVLGGWWAYEVLGWGGYWSWDPVENASFMPWLTATAALHALILPGRRGTLKGWTVTLVMATFLLTLLGTFMTRSGVFNSVHAFSQSDIGHVFLGFIALMLVGTVALLSLRLDKMETEGAPTATVSRESVFLLNNLLFVALTFTVLVGTTFPLLNEAIRGVKLSVGEPYFNRMAIPMGLTILYLMGIGPALPWGASTGAQVAKAIGLPLGLGAVGTIVAYAAGIHELPAALTVGGAIFATYVSVEQILLPVRVRMREHNEGFGTAFAQATRRGRRRFGGYIVHLGIITMILAIAMSRTYRHDRELTLVKGEPQEFMGYQITFTGTQDLKEAHRMRHVALIDVSKGGSSFSMDPALNNYDMSMNPIGSPAVHSTLTHDLYLSLMNVSKDGSTAGMHLYHTPLVAWIWIGSGIILLGSAISGWPARRTAIPVALAQAAK